MLTENNIKISVIIPVYNAEKYLDDCIKSVIMQTLSEWELILVNDGSKDNSSEICDKYARLDSRIKAIHKENAGVSVARNTGIENATGEFIGFIDADDTVLPDFFECMYSTAAAQQSDIVMCDALTVYQNGNTEADTINQLASSILLKKSDWSPKLLMEMAGAAWRCIYKRELIERNKILFPCGIKFSEDRIFNILSFGFADSIFYLKRPLYNRIMWEESAVHRFHADYFEAAKLSDTATLNAITTAWNDSEEYKNAYRKHLILASQSAIYNYFYKTSPMSFKEKYLAVKSLCNDAQLKDALLHFDCNDFRIKQIKKKHIFLLSLLAIFNNKLHKR